MKKKDIIILIMKNIDKKKIFLIIESLLGACSICYYCSFSQVSIFPLIIALLVYCFFEKVQIIKNWTIGVLSVFINILLLIGKYVVFVEEARNLLSLFFKMTICAVGGFVLFKYLISFVYDLFDKKKLNKNANKTIKPIYIFILSFVFIFLGWFIVLLVEYPGNIMPDTMNQFMQIFEDIPYHNDHPFIHTMYLKFLYDISCLFVNSMNSKVFVMSLIQTIIHSLVYSYFIYYLYKKTNNIYIVLTLNIYYGLISFNSTYNISLSKDTSFTLLSNLLLICFIELIYRFNIKNILIAIIIIVLFSNIRKNGLYAIIASVFFAFVILAISKKYVKLFMLLTTGLLLSVFAKYFVINPVTEIMNNDTTIVNTIYKNNNDGLNANNSDSNIVSAGIKKISLYVPAEIPMQLIANVVCHDRNLSEKEIWLIEEHCPIEIIKQEYDKYLLDPLAKASREHTTNAVLVDIPPIEYIKLFFELLIKYPQDYIEAYSYMTRYYYYPNRNINTNYYGISNNDYGIFKEPQIPQKTVSGIEQLLNDQRNIPYIGSLFSPGVIVIMVLIIFFYGLYTKDYSLSIMVSFLVGIWVTVILVTPCADEFRYIYPIVGTTPLLVLLPVLNNESQIKRLK